MSSLDGFKILYPEIIEPCPFCGGKARLHHIWNNRAEKLLHYVQCLDEYHTCKAWPKTLNYSSKKEALDAWNTRTENEAVVRCRDCVFCEQFDGFLGCVRTPFRYKTTEDDFCSRAVRKTGEQSK